MSALLGGRRRSDRASGAGLARGASALDAAVRAGRDRLEPGEVAEARAVVGRVGERTALAGGRTVVALAGATGSGKSSLFNALVGAPVATVGARRPTTATPTAAIWGEESAAELLDWLAVGTRHHVPARDGFDAAQGELDLDGLVLLDLPDFDSRELAHRAEADRVLRLVDLFVWVTDPQKYADARLHDDYLAALADHGAVTVVVLNQADRLSIDDAERCADDLRRLLTTDGVAGAEVFLTSATTGAGVVSLEHKISTVVRGHNAAEQRLLADVRGCAQRLRTGVADGEARLGERADDRLVEALSRAAGIPTVLSAVERDYRRTAAGHTGWPFTRWLRGLRPDPLKRLRLDPKRSTGQLSGTDVRLVLGRSSLPPASPAARSAVELATGDLGDRAAEGLPRPWAESVAEAASPPGPGMTDALDQAVMGTSLRGRTPWWWSVFGLLQWLLAAVAVAGLAWLLVLMVLGWLQLPDVQTPAWGPVPYPPLMLGGGLVLGLVLAGLGRVLGRVGARRRRRLVERRLRASVDTVAREAIVAPVRQVLAEHRETREQLEIARS